MAVLRQSLHISYAMLNITADKETSGGGVVKAA
jgi:hypothetical protein